MKKPSRITLKNKADRLWSEIIRSKGKCEVCGLERVQSHHIIGRRNLTLRYELRNGVALCPLHHTLGIESAHQDPLWFQDWMMKNRRSDLNYLLLKRMELSTQIDYGAIIEKLKEEYEKI
jgi:hypothetical protein